MSVSKTIMLLEARLLDLKEQPYKEVASWIIDIENSIEILRRSRLLEEDISGIYAEYLSDKMKRIDKILKED